MSLVRDFLRLFSAHRALENQLVAANIRDTEQKEEIAALIETRDLLQKELGAMEALQDALIEAQRDREIERTKRIAAEALAEERRGQADRANELALKIENSRDEAVKERIKTLDFVSGKLMEMVVPEKPVAVDPKQFSTLMQAKRVNSRDQAWREVNLIMDHFKQKKTPKSPVQ